MRKKRFSGEESGLICTLDFTCECASACFLFEFEFEFEFELEFEFEATERTNERFRRDESS